MTRREPVERIIVLCIRIYILYILYIQATPRQPSPSKFAATCTYDSLTGIIFEFLSPVIWLVFEKCTYMYMSFVCESCFISLLSLLFDI